MADTKDDERDEEWFKEVYGREYTGPPRPARDNTDGKKRSTTNANSSAGESDEDNEPHDPNAVPTDFTSREAKVWEAKAKAIERNWKRRKEEELICRICGESGHFSQGCPTTLGGNRKTGEIVERIAFKDKRLKPRIIGTGGSTVQNIEKDTGCRIKLEDNLIAGNGGFYVRISGTDRTMVGKAVDAVNRLVDQVDDDRKQQNMRRSQGSYSRGSNANPLIAAQMQHIATQRMQHNPNLQPYSARSDAPPLDEDQHGIEQIASQLEARRQWEVGSKNGPGSVPPSYAHNGGRNASGAGNMPSYNLKASGSEGASPYYHGDNQEGRVNQKGIDGNSNEQEQDMELGYDQQPPLPQTLEALEQRFVQEIMELTKEQNDAEDKENARHRECIRDIQEQYQQKMIALRAQQAKGREEFLRREAHVRQQQYQQQAGINHYNYISGSVGGSVAGFNGGFRDHPGYGTGPPEVHQGYGSGYASYKEEGQYYNTPHPYNRHPGGYNVGGMYPGGQGYDSAPYRY